jgi:D-lactate dehydrogenase
MGADTMITTAVFDTKPYDRDSLQRASQGTDLEWRFHEFRLTRETAALAQGAPAVCVFVNDQVDRPCLEALAAQGVKLVALRCTGFNNVDLAAAKALNSRSRASRSTRLTRWPSTPSRCC